MNILEISSWAEKNFQNIPLFNKKKQNRIIRIAAKLAEGKGNSLARLFDSWYDTKATYKLLREPLMTPDTIQHTHRLLTYENITAWKGDVLAIEDSSEFEWNYKDAIEGLGPIGSGRKKDQGFILHTTLTVGVNNENFSCQVLGIPFQQYYVRPPVREKRKKRASTTDPIETDLWREVIKHKALPPLNKVIRICDRAADIYEVLNETKEYGCKHIIRLKHNRVDVEFKKYIIDVMQNLESKGQTTIKKRFKSGTKNQNIVLEINWQKCRLRAPARPGIPIGRLPDLEETVVHVYGINPENGEAIEWFLYTDLEINSLKDAIKITQYYAQRWIIEDFHKTLKSGLKAEKLQLETAHAIFAAIAIMSVTAARIIDLREKLRTNPDSPAEESGLSKLELSVLGKYLKRDLKTIKCVVLALGRLGGHQNRIGDGMPGMLSLWWGMTRFLNIMEGVSLFTV